MPPRHRHRDSCAACSVSIDLSPPARAAAARPERPPGRSAWQSGAVPEARRRNTTAIAILRSKNTPPGGGKERRRSSRDPGPREKAVDALLQSALRGLREPPSPCATCSWRAGMHIASDVFLGLCKRAVVVLWAASQAPGRPSMAFATPVREQPSRTFQDSAHACGDGSALIQLLRQRASRCSRATLDRPFRPLRLQNAPVAAHTAWPAIGCLRLHAVSRLHATLRRGLLFPAFSLPLLHADDAAVWV
ncbi:uncharacterized protein BDZ99DRAFT_482071 [Mytilinidion resinicola]|uniref:Uncharacterized protein n=1 Tax=Mytilinidion resinicola TaxID=574789 RepID=A0A6A6Y631_9PEZI|nr:uncharacterized protein BDZ99DRAFT_482071 [Mytilinidion resinicola]KAF2803665.1 hypothetical protein BDZ99DRAFT_482071 [Mytilinidion resinicola]